MVKPASKSAPKVLKQDGSSHPNGHNMGAIGMRFIVTTPLHALDKQDRRLIRGHATKTRKKGRPASNISSWICPDRRLESPGSLHAEKAADIPGCVGTAFSGLQLPSGFEPYMIRELVKLIDINKDGVYPYEICVNIPPVERGWFPYMISDACCLHSFMFSLRVWEGKAIHGQLNRLACFHYDQTLRLLQARLFDYDQTSAVSDSTIMVVIMLATIAELMDEKATVENHIRGLEKIVKLRGGLGGLNTHRNMAVKVCRADLAFAMLSGKQPFLFQQGINWNCFINGGDYFRCSHDTLSPDTRNFIDISMHPKLQNCFKDVHALSCMSNLAFQTGRKLSPELYNEIMISILYRLIYLSTDLDDIQEAIRLGLLCFCSTTFMQRIHMEQPYGLLLNNFVEALSRLRRESREELPVQIAFWLLLLVGVVGWRKGRSLSHWHDAWLAEIIGLAKLDSWVQAKETLRLIAWVGFVHDEPGERSFDAARRKD